MFVTFYAIIFESQTLWIKKCWAACRKRILTWNSSQGHSRSCILQSVTGRQGVAYRHYIYNTAGLISEVSEEIATQIAKNCRRRQPPMSFWRPRPGESPRISAWILHFQKLESLQLAYIFVVDSMGLSSVKFVQWAPKDASLLQQSVGRKRILTSNSRSGSLKVIHFAIGYRPTRGSMSYNTAGLISEDSEEVAIQIAKNCRRRQFHSHLTPPPRGTPTNIPINLIFPETRIIGLHFCRW